MALQLLLVRHGETEENKLGILQGSKETVLNGTGMGQALKIALLLDVMYKDDIKRIYVSNRARALQTVEIINIALKKQVVIDDRLREIDIGDYEGKHKSEVSLKDMDYPPNGENIEQVYERVKGFLDELQKTHNNETILIVTHNVIIKTIICHIKYKRFIPVRELGLTVDNCMLCKLILGDK